MSQNSDILQKNESSARVIFSPLTNSLVPPRVRQQHPLQQRLVFLPVHPAEQTAARPVQVLDDLHPQLRVGGMRPLAEAVPLHAGPVHALGGEEPVGELQPQLPAEFGGDSAGELGDHPHGGDPLGEARLPGGGVDGEAHVRVFRKHCKKLEEVEL